jgi:hypothetical protein
VLNRMNGLFSFNRVCSIVMQNVAYEYYSYKYCRKADAVILPCLSEPVE